LGLALLHRYKSSRDGTNFDPRLLELLSPPQVKEAEILGRAMRFAAMLTLEKPMNHAALKLFSKKQKLQLTLKSKDAADLFGEVAEARFNALAAAMGCEPHIVYPRKRKS